MTSFTFRLCEILISGNRIEGLQDKLDVFLAVNRLTQEEYITLTEMLNKKIKENESLESK